MARPVYDIFEHFIDKENLGLICNRTVALNTFQHAFIANTLADLHILETASAPFNMLLLRILWLIYIF